MKKLKGNTEKFETIFVHSLFRSGSTFFYHALKRAEKYDVYHEPFHDVLGSISSTWDDLNNRVDYLKNHLRHDFLKGSYFDEYAHLLPKIKKTFDKRISYELFFLEEKRRSDILKSYIDVLIDGSAKRPILQCTRTIGRLGWLKCNYNSKHIFLLRNPWDQWYSYKVDNYIATSPQIIYSQPQIPPVLQEIMHACDFVPIPGADLNDQFAYCQAHPVTPQVDYFLFFGLWLFASIVGNTDCDIVLDMDSISSNKLAQEDAVRILSNIGLEGIILDDVKLHRALFKHDEINFYEHIESQVFEIFRHYFKNITNIQFVNDYLSSERKKSFIATAQTDLNLASILEDASRLRLSLRGFGQERSRSVSLLNETVIQRRLEISKVVAERDSYAARLAQADKELKEVRELYTRLDQEHDKVANWAQSLDKQISTFTQALSERDQKIAMLSDETVKRGEWALGLEAQIKTAQDELSRVVVERDNYGARLVQVDRELTEVRELYTRLDQEHDKVATWAQSLDKQISTFTQALSERDQKIAMLSDETVKRDEWALGLEAQIKTAQDELSRVVVERDNYGARLVQVDRELEEVRELYTRLDQEHDKVATWAQSLDKQILAAAQALAEREQDFAMLSDETEAQIKTAHDELSKVVTERDNCIARLGLIDKQFTEATKISLEREKQVAALSDEITKHRERTVGFETEFKSMQVELTRVISERDKQIAHLNQTLAGLNDQITKLNKELVKVASETKLQEQVYFNELTQNTLRFEQEKTQLLVVQSDKERTLGEEHAERERAIHERLIAMQAELLSVVQEWTGKFAIHASLAAQEKTDLQDEIADLYQHIQDSDLEKVRRACAQSDKDRALDKEHAELEHTLHERIYAMQAELRKADQEWMEACAAQENLASLEKIDSNNKIEHLQTQIKELNLEKTQLSASYAEHENVLMQQNDECERLLHEGLLAVQNEFSQNGCEWAEKTAAQQLELAECQQSSALMRAQLQDQINAAEQRAAHWELAQNTLRIELNVMKSSPIWRLTAPLRKTRSWNFSPKSNKASSAHQTFNSANDNPADTQVAVDHDKKIDRRLDEVSMTINPMVPVNYLNCSITSVEDLLDYHDEAFICAAYRTLLLRAVDTEGITYYVRRLRRGVDKLQVLDQICRSNEAKVLAVKLPGLENALRRNRWLKLPVIGAMLRKQGPNQKLLALENQLFLLNESNGTRFDQMEKAIISLQHTIVQQAQTAAGAAAIQQFGYAAVDSWQTVEKLLSFEGSNFLENLFQLALGRFPEAHEVDHYLHVLGKGVSKLYIIESIFSCAECKTLLAPERADVVHAEVRVIAQSVPDRKHPVTVAAESICFAEHERPLVSVVIPVYGKIEYTLMCLRAIQKNVPEVEFEIIVVDDKSSDNTVSELLKVTGIRLVVNTENLGFIRSCNHGAEHAKGQYLCFLNNDTEVAPGWLDELVRTFDDFSGTGLAGSKLVYPNGTLQEAGGILWQDGSAWNFGRNQDPSLPIYNYAREVDYCSGASIMLPSALFIELGGFDEHYLPAYCEDSDLALKVRDRGYRVIYQPLSVVVHYEGITSGTDTSQGAKAYQIENSKKLFARWKDRLKNHQPNSTEIDKAKDRMVKLRVLVLDHCTPTPNHDAGSVTVFNLLLLLREMDFQVTFIPEDNFLYMPEYTSALQRIGVEVLYAPYFTSVEQHLAESGSRYELAFLFRPVVVERHLKMVRKHCPTTKVLYHTIDLHYLRMMREAELLGDRAQQKAAEEMKRLEFYAIRSVDAAIVHSTSELEILRPDFPVEKIYVFPLILNIRGTDRKYQNRSDIVFVGGYQHAPNVDAVRYFVKEVMPLLRCQLPGIRFYAVGSKPPQEILDLAVEDVIVTGFVEDLNPFLDKMCIAVAPLRYGAGIKGKIGTAMSAGLPTVATTLAAEGMKLTDGENILVADGHQELAAAIIKLYNDEILWNKISATGLTFAESAWGAEAAFKILATILNDLDLKVAKNGRPLRLYSAESPQISQKKEIIHQLLLAEVTQAVKVDAYAEKVLQELKIFEKQVKVHDLPEIFHYWSNKWLKPMFQEAGFDNIENFFSKNLLAASGRTKLPHPRFVSIGSGNCDLEVSIAKKLRQSGLNEFVFECIEINPAMVSRGRKIAEDAGVLDVMHFTEADFNAWVPEVVYDGVMANQSLHHVTELEHLFGQINEKLHPQGAFVISDMIGRNGHQRWSESYELVQKFWKELPESYKINAVLDRHEKEYENWDCSKEGFEGIRAQDILPLLLDSFYCDTFVGFCSAIDIFVDRCFGHHFNSNAEWDKDFIDRVHLVDEEGLKNGTLTPTHCCAVFVKQRSAKPFYSRGLDPKCAIRRA